MLTTNLQYYDMINGSTISENQKFWLKNKMYRNNCKETEKQVYKII